MYGLFLSLSLFFVVGGGDGGGGTVAHILALALTTYTISRFRNRWGSIARFSIPL